MSCLPAMSLWIPDIANAQEIRPLVEDGAPLEKIEEEWDSYLEVTQSPMLFSRSAASDEPQAELNKTAKWLDIEEGFAEIHLQEEDTPGYVNPSTDYLIILDRTRTMSLSDRTFQGGESDRISEVNSPCLNRDHYYEYNGRKLDLFDYHNGIDRDTKQAVVIPEGTELYNCHKNKNGESILVHEGNGCVDRLQIAKNTICSLVDQIGARQTNSNRPNRVSFWSFAGTYWPEQDGELDTDHEKGIYNYIALTNNYEAVKSQVRNVQTYSGTYYQESMKRAFEQLSARTGNNKDIPSKVIFISDGKCSDAFDEVTFWNNKLKGIPNCKIYTLAVGMPVASEGAELLKRLSSTQDAQTFAAFTTNLNTSNPAFANTLAAIEASQIEVHAKEKIVEDIVDTRYWDIIGISSCDGEAAIEGNKVIWKIPTGANKQYNCKIKIKLKDKYRFLISDTSYPTNYDTENEKGCGLTYTIDGGTHAKEQRKLYAETPVLKYGTIKVEGVKNWTIENSNEEVVLFKLYRKISGQDQKEMLNEAAACKEDHWEFEITEKETEKDHEIPLVLYTNQEVKYDFLLEEETSFYTAVKKEVTLENNILHAVFENEPYKIKVRMEKIDSESKERLSDAVFGVYCFSKKENRYIPYMEMSGSNEKQVVLKETEQGIYVSEQWLYYTPDNEGRFRIIEEKAPVGYTGDFLEDGKTKKVYDVSITRENTGSTCTKDDNGRILSVENQMIKGSILIEKKDADSRLPIPQGSATLYYEEESKNAVYGLFAAEDIVRAGKIIYPKDTEIMNGHISSEGLLRFEQLIPGNYYIKEIEGQPKGYLLDDKLYKVSLKATEEHIKNLYEYVEVFEPIKKQKITIRKVTGSNQEPVSGAGFKIFSLSQLVNEDILEKTDAEITEYLIETYRDKKTASYEALRDLNGIVLYENGEEFVTKEYVTKEGKVELPALPYGDYVLVETSIPEKFRAVDPFILRIREDDHDLEVKGDGKGKEREEILLVDEKVQVTLQIIKKDAATKQAVKDGEVAYVLKDTKGIFAKAYLEKASLLEKAKYMMFYQGLLVQYDTNTKKMTGTYENPFKAVKTKKNGEICLIADIKDIPEGTYELCEVSAPKGYVLYDHKGVIAKDRQSNYKNQTFFETKKEGKWEEIQSEPIIISIDRTTGTFIEETNQWEYEVIVENSPVIGKLSVYAWGEKLSGIDDVIAVPQIGAEFVLTAAEDIKDLTGKTIYKKGQCVEILKTDENGKAWTGTTDDKEQHPIGLYLGKYNLQQTKAGKGFELENAKEIREIEITYKDDKTPVIYADEEFSITIPRTAGNNPTTKDRSNIGCVLLMGLFSALIIIRKRVS